MWSYHLDLLWKPTNLVYPRRLLQVYPSRSVLSIITVGNTWFFDPIKYRGTANDTFIEKTTCFGVLCHHFVRQGSQFDWWSPVCPDVHNHNFFYFIFQMFLIINGCTVLFMQCGFALLEAGAVRAKNVTNILMKNFLDACKFISENAW